MGDYAVAIADHALAAGAPLPVDLLAQSVTPVLERHRNEFERWWTRRPEWPISVPEPDFAWHVVGGAPLPEMRGPFNLYIEVWPRLVTVHLPMKWGAFLEGGRTGTAVRETIEAICTVLGSNVVACASDFWSLEDDEMASMDALLAAMQQRTGPPHSGAGAWGEAIGDSSWFVWNRSAAGTPGSGSM